MNPGSIVKARNRYWVLLPHDDPNIYLLRPLTGAIDETIAIHKELTKHLGYTLPEERPQSAQFPLPTAQDVSDAASAHLLWQAARLSLREGASPLRSLGRISIRPRPYQFVPLLMALRLDPIRMLIADDVGVGKTIEALLIARELWERGEIKRMAVLCPPYLCDQWQQELKEKFNFHDAVVIRSGTVRALERNKPANRTIYEHYPVQVISIDFIKSDQNRHAFLLHTPDLIIVDEAHGAAMASRQNQQQRHEFLREVAKDHQKHLLLLTATPHSGVESAFQSLLGLLTPSFAEWELSNLNDSQFRDLARHFVQRTRADITGKWEGATCFPTRVSEDRTYRLSGAYRDLFDKTYAFCAEIVRTGQTLKERQRRVRYWGALALLRCIMSSPAAALAALEKRHDRLVEGEDEVDFRGFVFESDQQETDDEQPTTPIEETESTLAESEQRKLRTLEKLAVNLQNSGQDTKLKELLEVVKQLIAEGFAPIVWCRYVATAEYVAEALRNALKHTYPDLEVACVTGRQGDEERRLRIAEIDTACPHVLVATDCLSEGINLQEKFTAVIHYDLPWNPNRLEQREGRVDRYGQTAKTVKVVRYFGKDNPVDGVVVDVLLNKANQIYQTLGTHVPVPEESESVTEAVLNALFLRGGYQSGGMQMAFDFMPPEVSVLHSRWEKNAERERATRNRFAQHALKPEEVQRELEAADAVLGDPHAVQEFVLNAAQRIGLTIQKRQNNVFEIVTAQNNLIGVPEAVCFALPETKSGWWRISFVSPTPEGATYLGRNHPFVQALARYLFESALMGRGKTAASRAGALITSAVSQHTVLLLLRVRYLLDVPGRSPLFSEEVRVLGFTRAPGKAAQWLPESEALSLLGNAQPSANLPLSSKQEAVQAELNAYPALENDLRIHLEARARQLEEAHRRIRKAARISMEGLTIQPQYPPDLLGILVLLPAGGEA